MNGRASEVVVNLVLILGAERRKFEEDAQEPKLDISSIVKHWKSDDRGYDCNDLQCNNITPFAEGHWKICHPRAKHYVARGPQDAARGP